MAEKQKRVFWTPEQYNLVAKEGVRLMRERNAEIKWNSTRRYGITELIMDGQKVLPKELHRPETHALIHSVAKLMQAIAQGESNPAQEKPAAVEVHEAPARQTEVAAPPTIPNRLGLDPRFADSMVYVAQSVTKVIADAMAAAQGAAIENAARVMGEVAGATFAESMRQVLRDMRLGMFLGTPNAPKPETPQVEQPARSNGHGNLPEKFNRRKILIIGMLADQRSQLERRFPRVDFRWAAGDAPASTVQEISRTCDLAISSKWTSHKAIPKVECKYVHAQAVSGISQKIEEHFPELKAATAAERRESVAH